MSAEQQIITYSLGDIREAARRFWAIAGNYRCLAFSGGLGAGKTTFIHALCDELGVKDNVSSPTFALINEYHFLSEGTDRIIYHMDWYRLGNAAEAVQAGMEDCLLQPDAWCFIEWPEQAPELLRPPYAHVTIEADGASERRLHIALQQ